VRHDVQRIDASISKIVDGGESLRGRIEVPVAARTGRRWSPLDELRQIVNAVSIPVGTVGGLTVEEASRTPDYGAAVVILATPLTVRPDDFSVAEVELKETIRSVCRVVHGE
jgi:3-hexulose-6-phosphate synthase/6-phospho-3-hexuloisomerase